jgi:hypothetical protein
MHHNVPPAGLGGPPYLTPGPVFGGSPSVAPVKTSCWWLLGVYHVSVTRALCALWIQVCYMMKALMRIGVHMRKIYTQISGIIGTATGDACREAEDQGLRANIHPRSSARLHLVTSHVRTQCDAVSIINAIQTDDAVLSLLR